MTIIIYYYIILHSYLFLVKKLATMNKGVNLYELINFDSLFLFNIAPKGVQFMLLN